MRTFRLLGSDLRDRLRTGKARRGATAATTDGTGIEISRLPLDFEEAELYEILSLHGQIRNTVVTRHYRDSEPSADIVVWYRSQQAAKRAMGELRGVLAHSADPTNPRSRAVPCQMRFWGPRTIEDPGAAVDGDIY